MIDAQQSGNIPNLAPRESMSTEIVGQVLESYQITALAGKGGMGAVYKARDLRLDRDVAIKVMDPHLAGDEAFMKTCFPCHEKTRASDLVFTRYAP